MTRVGGYLPSPPAGAAQLAVEAEMRRLWEDPGGRVLLQAAGFTDAPRKRKSTAGRRVTTTDRVLAVRARRTLEGGYRAGEEKLLTQARRARILQERPHANEFTHYGKALLRQCDRAGVRLVAFLDECGGTADVETFAPLLAGPLKPDAVRGAIDDLISDGKIRVVRYATAAERRRHSYVVAEVALVSAP
jgi:hypothetical protein